MAGTWALPECASALHRLACITTQLLPRLSSQCTAQVTSHADAVLVFASLAVMLLYKGYGRLVDPHAAGNTIAMTHHSTDKVQMHCCRY